jgi:hypothetical protein
MAAGAFIAARCLAAHYILPRVVFDLAARCFAKDGGGRVRFRSIRCRRPAVDLIGEAGRCPPGIDHPGKLHAKLHQLRCIPRIDLSPPYRAKEGLIITMWRPDRSLTGRAARRAVSRIDDPVRWAGTSALTSLHALSWWHDVVARVQNMNPRHPAGLRRNQLHRICINRAT